MISLRDANGNWHSFAEEDLAQQLVDNSHRIYGMSLNAIGAFRRYAMSRGVKMPITEQSLKEVLDAES